MPIETSTCLLALVMPSEIVTFLMAVTRSDGSYSRMVGFILAYNLRVNPIMVPGEWGGWSHCTLSQEAERDGCWCSAHFLLCMQCRTSVNGLMSTFREGLPVSVKYPWQHPHRHAQRSVSWGFWILSMEDELAQRQKTISQTWAANDCHLGILICEHSHSWAKLIP